MDLLKNWLSSTVEQELNVVLEKAKASGEISTARDVSYEDDGSNLRVTSSKSGVIQIIKVPFGTPNGSGQWLKKLVC